MQSPEYSVALAMTDAQNLVVTENNNNKQYSIQQIRKGDDFIILKKYTDDLKKKAHIHSSTTNL